jgi:Flp pilus assembly protein TadG
VTLSSHLRSWSRRLAGRAWRDDRAAQLVEFAVALPLLVVFVVGIFDFSNAFTLKQKLTNAARDGARVAAADPASDLSSPSTPVPSSVIDAYQVVYNNLAASSINTCGLLASGGNAPSTSTGLTWTYTGTTNCPPGGLTITVNRGYYFPQTGATLPSVTCASQSPGGQTTLIGTCVSIQFAYPWRFGKVASLMGRTASLPTQVTAAAVAMNEN